MTMPVVEYTASNREPDFGDKDHLVYNDNTKYTDFAANYLRAFDLRATNEDYFYRENISKMLGSQRDLVKWLMEIGLLNESLRRHSTSMHIIGAPFQNDRIQFQCLLCLKKFPIRQDSFFSGLKCDIRSVIRMLHGWILDIELDEMENLLGLDRQVVGTVYNRAAAIALNSLRSNPDEMKLGGYNRMVYINIFPKMLKTIGGAPINSSMAPILCLVDMMNGSSKFWLEPLEPWNDNNPSEVDTANRRIVRKIVNLVKLGSILIRPLNATLNFEEHIHTLDQFFNVIPMDAFQEYIPPSRLTLEQLHEAIWRNPIAACERAQYYYPDFGTQSLIRSNVKSVNVEFSFSDLLLLIVQETSANNMASLYKL